MHTGVSHQAGLTNQTHRHNGQQQRFSGQQAPDPQKDQELAQYFTMKNGQNGQSAGSLA